MSNCVHTHGAELLLFLCLKIQITSSALLCLLQRMNLPRGNSAKEIYRVKIRHNKRIVFICVTLRIKGYERHCWLSFFFTHMNRNTVLYTELFNHLKTISASLAAKKIHMTYFWSITKGIPFIDT